MGRRQSSVCRPRKSGDAQTDVSRVDRRSGERGAYKNQAVRAARNSGAQEGQCNELTRLRPHRGANLPPPGNWITLFIPYLAQKSMKISLLITHIFWPIVPSQATTLFVQYNVRKAELY